MPYGNRVIHIDFPEVSDPDNPADAIWIKMRNPRFLSPSEVDERAAVRAARRAAEAAGQDPADVIDENSSYAMFAKLIIGWHVYDATDDSENPEPMGSATVENVKKLPLEILERLGEELAIANPQKPTESQEAGTSKTS